jgi:hypothetical protein
MEAKAEAFLRAFKAQLRDLGSSVRILKPVDSIDANEAIQLLKRHAVKHGRDAPSCGIWRMNGLIVGVNSTAPFPWRNFLRSI